MMDKKVYYIYKTIDPVTGEFYIGKHYGYLNDKYKGSGNWVKKHPNKQRLRKEILAQDISSDDYAMQIESVYINMNIANTLNMNVNYGWRSNSKSVEEPINSIVSSNVERVLSELIDGQNEIKKIQEEILKKQSIKMKFQPSRELSKLLYL